MCQVLARYRCLVGESCLCSEGPWFEPRWGKGKALKKRDYTRSANISLEHYSYYNVLLSPVYMNYCGPCIRGLYCLSTSWALLNQHHFWAFTHVNVVCSKSGVDDLRLPLKQFSLTVTSWGHSLPDRWPHSCATLVPQPTVRAGCHAIWCKTILLEWYLWLLHTS